MLFANIKRGVGMKLKLLHEDALRGFTVKPYSEIAVRMDELSRKTSKEIKKCIAEKKANYIDFTLIL
jgi:hypothetical protein